MPDAAPGTSFSPQPIVILRDSTGATNTSYEDHEIKLDIYSASVTGATLIGGSLEKLGRDQGINKGLADFIGNGLNIDKPGTYDLYCFQVAHEDTVAGNNQARLAALPDKIKQNHSLDPDGTLIDSKTGRISERYSLTMRWQRHKWPPSPLVEKMPADIVAYAGKSWNVQNVTDFAHFGIVIKQGSDLQRENMISCWTLLQTWGQV